MRFLFLVLLLSSWAWAENSLTDRQWLVGEWRSADGMEENWGEAGGGAMMGTCRDAAEGHFEFMLMEEGKLLLYLPRHDKKMQFRLARQSSEELVFEREDAPESVTYRHLPDGQLHIRLVKKDQSYEWKLRKKLTREQ